MYLLALFAIEAEHVRLQKSSIMGTKVVKMMMIMAITTDVQLDQGKWRRV